jgi:hypothetical protein
MYHKDLGESPETAIWGDKPILICVAFYIIVVVVIIYA